MRTFQYISLLFITLLFSFSNAFAEDKYLQEQKEINVKIDTINEGLNTMIEENKINLKNQSLKEAYIYIEFGEKKEKNETILKFFEDYKIFEAEITKDDIKDTQYILNLPTTGEVDKAFLQTLQKKLKTYKQKITQTEEYVFEDINGFCPEGSAFCSSKNESKDESEKAFAENKTRGDNQDIQNMFFKKIAEDITKVAASIAIFMLIITSIKLVGSAGDSGAFKQQIGNLKGIGIGLIVILFSYFFITAIIELLYKFF
jgi:hypothetical protein